MLLAAAVLWPSRLAGPLDGAPLDTTADALVIGLVVPALVALDRRILKRRMVRGLIVVLLAWKAMLAVSLVQDGWCLRFTSPVPLFVNQERVPHAWDIRADWRSDPPRCSAVMTRGYESIDRFPVWFYNLPPANFSEAARADERPPLVTVAIDIDGFIQSDRSGVLRIVSGNDVRLSARIDDEPVEAAALAAGITVAPGTHAVALNGSASGERWALLAHWNGVDVWTSATATMTAPRALRPVGATLGTLGRAAADRMAPVVCRRRDREEGRRSDGDDHYRLNDGSCRPCRRPGDGGRARCRSSSQPRHLCGYRDGCRTFMARNC